MDARLDDPSFVLRHDPKGMYGLTLGFADQCVAALGAADAADPALKKPENIVLAGLGGSAAGGDLARCLFEADGRIPFAVCRDYVLPRYVGRETLVLAVSYSGNTEETLAAVQEAKSRGAQIAAVTSGGELARLAEENGWPCVRIPGGQPPRTALGFLFLPVVRACEQAGLLPEQDYGSLVALLRECAQAWSIERAGDENEAKRLACGMHGKLALLYGLGSWQSAVAYRWKGQINENAKNMAFYHAYPELCHNEVLGWVLADRQGVAAWTTLVLQDGTESPKMKKRAEVTASLTRSVTTTVPVFAPGDRLIERMLALTLLGDFVSLYLAALNGVDPENIDSINTLKAELANVP